MPNYKFKRYSLFHGLVSVAHGGVECGNCKADADREGALQRINTAIDALDIWAVFAPSLNFTNRVVNFSDKNDVFQYDPQVKLFRTREKADAAITDQMNIGLAVFNADCHLGIIYNINHRQLALVHLGLKCFFRPAGEESILVNTVKAMNANPQTLKLWVGAGIGPCCNGYSSLALPDREAISARFPGCVGGQIQKGPRRGQEAYNNLAMILQQAAKIGFYAIEVDPVCTSCHGVESDEDRGLGTYFSNVRGSKNERNLFIATLRNY